MPASAPPALRWTRERLLLAPPVGRRDWASHAQAPTALALSERHWRVYFAGRDSGNRSQIFYADFDPGDDFRLLHLEDRPLLEPGAPGRFDCHGMGPATAMRVGRQVWLYYSGISRRSDVPYQIAVGLAVSDDDGHSFRRAVEGPVIGAGPHDPCFASTPFVWRDGERFLALYNSATGWVQHDARWECRYDLRAAVSTDGIHWQAHAGSALGLVEGEAGLARPWVQQQADGLRMWFCRRGLDRFRSADGNTYRIQTAGSPDGRHWQRDGGDLEWVNPPRAGDWDSWMQAYPCVLPRGDELVMLYNGNDFGRGGFGWARARPGS